jgi:hypothetical protein
VWGGGCGCGVVGGYGVVGGWVWGGGWVGVGEGEVMISCSPSPTHPQKGNKLSNVQEIVIYEEKH